VSDKTPRTDAFVDMILMGAKGHSSQELIDFARTLERELAALREERRWIDGAAVTVEHGWICVRNDTGWLLWDRKISDTPPSGWELGTILKIAGQNAPAKPQEGKDD